MLNRIIDVVKYCGKILLNANAKIINTKDNNYRNIVTDCDTQIQEILHKRLLDILPDASFLGEEGIQSFNKEGYCFVCDPIDGTTNFVKNLKHSAISVALLSKGKPILGVIYNPYLDELFYAEKNKGAFCNGKQIYASSENLRNSLIVFGTSPYDSDLQKQTWNLAEQSLKMGLDVRRTGSAVLDLADLACGRYGAFWELKLRPWDFSAGVLIIEEAGGIVRTMDNKPLDNFFETSSVVALANKSCEEFFETINLL